MPRPPLTGAARTSGLIAAICGLALLAAACGSSTTNQGQSQQQGQGDGSSAAASGAQISGPADGTSPKPGGKAVFGMEAETVAIDPTRIPLAVSGHLVASAVFDSLVTVDDKGKAQPYLAKSIEPSADNKTWTITIPEGLKFTSGTPLDANALKANFDAYKSGSVTGSALTPLKEIVVTSPTSIELRLDIPWVRFNDALASQIAYVVDPEMITNADLGETPVGSGPFVFDSHTPNSPWKLTRNKDFRIPGRPYLDAIEFAPIPDDAARLTALETGDVDIMHTNKPEQILQLRANDSFKKVEYSNGEKDFLVMNTQKAPFDNVKARRAIAYASNVPKWLSDVNKGVKPPAYGPLSPGQPGYKEGNTTGLPQYDPEQAKQLVKEYEQEAGKPLEFEYIARDDPANMRDAQFFVDNWTAAGMKVTLKGWPQTQLVAQVGTGLYQLGEWRLFGAADPDADSYFWKTSSIQPLMAVSLNFPRYGRPEIDEALNKALAATDDSLRAEQYTSVQNNFGENVPYLWLGRTDWMMAARPSVNGMYPAVNGTIQTLGPKTWVADLWLAR
ncbi:MAG: ABC transporter substrate-binding protein [Acidimicrobiales bacterium]